MAKISEFIKNISDQSLPVKRIVSSGPRALLRDLRAFFECSQATTKNQPQWLASYLSSNSNSNSFQPYWAVYLRPLKPEQSDLDVGLRNTCQLHEMPQQANLEWLVAMDRYR